MMIKGRVWTGNMLLLEHLSMAFPFANCLLPLVAQRHVTPQLSYKIRSCPQSRTRVIRALCRVSRYENAMPRPSSVDRSKLHISTAIFRQYNAILTQDETWVQKRAGVSRQHRDPQRGKQECGRGNLTRRKHATRLCGLLVVTLG